MKINSQAEAVKIINEVMPYPEHITDWDLNSSRDLVRFKWRGDLFSVNIKYASVEQIDGHIAMGSNISILVKALIQNRLMEIRRKQLIEPTK